MLLHPKKILGILRTDIDGQNVASAVSVRIKTLAGDDAVLYSNSTGLSTLENPLLTNTNGELFVWLPQGRYVVVPENAASFYIDVVPAAKEKATINFDVGSSSHGSFSYTVIGNFLFYNFYLSTYGGIDYSTVLGTLPEGCRPLAYVREAIMLDNLYVADSAADQADNHFMVTTAGEIRANATHTSSEFGRGKQGVFEIAV